MAAYIITDKNNLVAIADAIRAQTGSTEPMTLGAMQAAVTSGGVNTDNIVIGLGEDGLVYAFVDGQPVSTGVKKEDLIIVAPGDPDEPDTPSTFGLAPGLYEEGAIQLALDGDIEAAQLLIWADWDQTVTYGATIVDGVLDLSAAASETGGLAADVVIPYDGSITGLSSWCFGGSMIQHVYIPDSVTEIGDYAFTSCSNLKTVKIPSGVSEIKDGTFSCCSSLRSVYIPISVTYIGESAFDSTETPLTIHYEGSAADWRNVSINQMFNDALTTAEMQYNSYDN